MRARLQGKRGNREARKAEEAKERERDRGRTKGGHPQTFTLLTFKLKTEDRRAKVTKAVKKTLTFLV